MALIATKISKSWLPRFSFIDTVVPSLLVVVIMSLLLQMAWTVEHLSHTAFERSDLNGPCFAGS